MPSEQIKGKRIAVHVPVFKRWKEQAMSYDCLERVLREFRELGYSTEVYVAGTEARDIDMANERGYKTLHVANRPVGRKFHELLMYMRRDPWDYLMEWCSDNCVVSGWSAMVHDVLTMNADVVYTDAFYITRFSDKKAMIFEGGNSNVGRITTREIVEKCIERHGYCFEPRKHRRIDYSYARLFMKYANSMLCLGRTTPILIDVKSELNINGWDSYSKNRETVSLTGDFPEYFKHHPLWQQQQEKSGPTKSASTSALTPQQGESAATHSEMTQAKTTALSSSPAQPPAASAAASKSSTRRRKTTMAKGKSSREDSNGQ